MKRTGKRSGRRIWAILLALLVVFTALPMTALAVTPATISSITIEITDPVDGETPSFSPTIRTTGCTLATDLSDASAKIYNGVAWYAVVGKNMMPMSRNSVFKAGQKYRAAIMLKTKLN